jgi:hypothetical protein
LSTKASSALLIALLAGACAREAPGLPPNLSDRPAEQRLLAGDLDSAEAKLDCAELAAERSRNRATADQLEKAIAGNRGHNQAVGYFSAVLFPPLLLAIKPDSDAKKTLDELQAQRDRIDRLRAAHRCSGGS